VITRHDGFDPLFGGVLAGQAAGYSQTIEIEFPSALRSSNELLVVRFCWNSHIRRNPCNSRNAGDDTVTYL
jgi:hypothetical protein